MVLSDYLVTILSMAVMDGIICGMALRPDQLLLILQVVACKGAPGTTQ